LFDRFLIQRGFVVLARLPSHTKSDALAAVATESAL
jgi:hypothetical protein